jgi:pimeloyl-ACP methyl ester carboxylesterase
VNRAGGGEVRVSGQRQQRAPAGPDWPAPRHVAVEGVRFAVHRRDPPRHRRTVPALLLHGVPETALMWRRLAAELAADRIVLAPDLKGLGGSEPAGRYDLPTLVRELAALALHEVDGPVDVVGHDWGGVIAIALSRSRPELVRRLVVVNAPYRYVDLRRAPYIPAFALPLAPEAAFAVDRRALVRGMIRYAWRAPRPLDPAVLEHYLDAYAAPERIRAMLAYYRAAVRDRLRHPARVLGLVRGAAGPGPGGRSAGGPGGGVAAAAPALVVWGAADPVLPLQVAETVVRDLGPGTTSVTVPGAGHFVVEEAPEVAVPAIARYLRAGEVPAVPELG